VRKHDTSAPLADDLRINAGDIRIDLTVDLLLAYRPTS
jgi:hypothetical protein